LEDGQAELQRMRERAQGQAQALNNEFQVKIKPHIEAVAKDKQIDIILDSQVALTVNRDFDISRDVIVEADDAGKAAKGAAPPANARAPPPRQPAPSSAQAVAARRPPAWRARSERPARPRLFFHERHRHRVPGPPHPEPVPLRAPGPGARARSGGRARG